MAIKQLVAAIGSRIDSYGTLNHLDGKDDMGKGNHSQKNDKKNKKPKKGAKKPEAKTSGR